MSEAKRCRLYERGPDGKPTFKFDKDTNLTAKFAAIRKQLAKATPPANVTPIRKAKP